MISAKEISKFHDQYLADPSWPDDFTLQYQASHTIFELIEANHFFNTKLWNEEDLARRQKVSDTEIANNKRAIDKFNQARNDYIERIDSYILKNIAHLSDMRGKQNSETLGSMIDRLSILSLKIFHMSLQTQRNDVEKDHLDICSKKLNILNIQRNDLGVCFDELMMDCQSGSRYFKQYKQFKMYNDPNLNPKIYSEK
jgi:Protein of unknown function (DUF4254)